MHEERLTPEVIARFWSKVAKTEDGCWNWTGWRNVEGYGRLDIGSWKPLATHIALFLAGRPRPSPKHLALHGDTCTPACCNPAHLRWGSGKENSDDRDRLGRRTARRGVDHWRAKLSEADVRAIRASTESQYRMAEEYGVSQVMISRIKTRKAWAWLD